MRLPCALSKAGAMKMEKPIKNILKDIMLSLEKVLCQNYRQNQ
jgi:hypothetical protein